MNPKDRDRLTNLGIFELRDFARQIGVASPTTLKKQELVEVVMDVLDGKPYDHVQSKKGRPPKTTASTMDFISMFLPSDIDDFSYGNTETKNDNQDDTWNKPNFEEDFNFVLQQNKASYNDELKLFDGDDKEEIEGLLDVHPKGYGIIRTDGYKKSRKDAYISVFFINRYHLRKGNSLRVITRCVKDDFPRNVVRIISIDGIPADSYDMSVCYLQDETTAPTENFKMGNMNIAESSKNVLSYDGDVSLFDKGMELLKSVEEPVQKMLVSLRNKDTINEVRDDIHVVSLDYSFTEKDRTLLSDMAFAKARRLAEQSKHVLLVVDCLSDLLRAFSVANSENASYDYVSNSALEKIKDYIAQPRKLKVGGGSITLVFLQNTKAHHSIVDVLKYDVYPMLNVVDVK